MKKDIQIPEVKDLAMAVVFEHNKVFKTDDWNVYVINNKPKDLEMVVIVSKGFNDKDRTSVMRKKLDLLPANSFAKVEMIQPELFKLNNLFQVSFFENNTIYEKSFLFPSGSIRETNLRMISSIKKRGILIK